VDKYAEAERVVSTAHPFHFIPFHHPPAVESPKRLCDSSDSETRNTHQYRSSQTGRARPRWQHGWRASPSCGSRLDLDQGCDCGLHDCHHHRCCCRDAVAAEAGVHLCCCSTSRRGTRRGPWLGRRVEKVGWASTPGTSPLELPLLHCRRACALTLTDSTGTDTDGCINWKGSPENRGDVAPSFKRGRSKGRGRAEARAYAYAWVGGEESTREYSSHQERRREHQECTCMSIPRGLS